MTAVLDPVPARRRARPLLAVLLSLAAVAALVGPAFAQDSRFTYQGQLKQSGVPVNATPDLEFRLFDQPQGGNQVGPTVTRPDVPVANGLFSVDIDFGASAFVGGPRWIETRVEGQALSPRQAVNAVPIAAYALAGPSGSGSPTISFPGDRLYAAVDLASSGSVMAVLISGITGGSTTLAGGLDVLSYALDVTAPPPPSGGGGTAGRPTFSNLRLLVREDESTPSLFTRVAFGTFIPTARLEVRGAAAGGGTRPLTRICLEELIVARVAPLGRTGIVEVGLAPTRIGGRQFSYGAGGPAQVATWGYDLATNMNWVPPLATCPNT